MIARRNLLVPRYQKCKALSKGLADTPLEEKQTSNENYKTTATFGSVEDHLNVYKIISTMQRHGHTIADTNPLDRRPVESTDWQISSLKSITGPHVNIPENKNDVYRLPSFALFERDWKNPYLSLGDIYKKLFKSYAGPIGVEYMHIKNEYERGWIRSEFEQMSSIYEHVLPYHRQMTMKKLIESRVFEQFISKMYPVEALSSIEGCDALLPALKILVNIGMERGAEKFIVGMPSRGRLNFLSNFMNKDHKKVLGLLRNLGFSGKYSGDIKYHLGSRVVQKGPNGLSCEILLCYNPSHKEMSNAIVAGKAAADQRILYGNNTKKVWPILIHSDIALQTQGIVYEYFNLCNLKHYKSNGAIHISINNQSGLQGLQSGPVKTRPTDVAKLAEAPIIHVNADEIDHVIYATILAARYRSTFLKDVVIDLVGYSRAKSDWSDVNDELPLSSISKAIESHPPVSEIYKAQLIREKLITSSEIDDYARQYQSLLETKYEESLKETAIQPSEWQDEEPDPAIPSSSLIDESMFDKYAVKQISHELTQFPSTIQVHDSIKAMFLKKENHLSEGIVDFTVAESLAIASLLKKYHHVRFCGIDVQRGTFHHRHHIIQDQQTVSDGIRSINILSKEWHGDEGIDEYNIFNTPLTQACALGFELGYSTCKTDVCVIWESQYGDLTNMAQIIIDQFVTSMEEKWGKASGMIFLLPHGLEGQGPDKSSARPERFLQMVHDDYETIIDDKETIDLPGIVLVNVTTSANYYHLIRRQYQVNVRKPLVLIGAKSFFNNKQCMSKIEEFYNGSTFQPYLPDPNFTSKDAKLKAIRVLLCSGKLYYTLLEERQTRGLDEVIAICRVEQLHPLPKMQIRKDLESFPLAANVFWVQEEPKNQGFWTFMKPRLDYILSPSNKTVGYMGRKPLSCGSQIVKEIFRKEEKEVFEAAFDIL